MKDPDCNDTPDVICPYCGTKQSDSWELFLDGDDMIKAECEGCTKTFSVVQYVSVTYSSYKEETPCPK